MIVRFTPRAAQDLSEIASYIQSRNPSGAQRVRAAILTSVDIVARFPGAGRLQNVENVRKLAVRRYPYLIYYTVDLPANELAIVAIRHAARNREYDDA